MITGTLRTRIDKLWEEFWTGGIANPLTVIEQISFLMFLRLLDGRETLAEKKSRATGKPFTPIYKKDEQGLRWQSVRNLDGPAMLARMRDEVFPHLRAWAKSNGEKDPRAKFFGDAQLLIAKPTLMVSAVNMIEDLPLDDRDTKGDLYEYLLSKLTTAGINGQFRTPRHIIRFMCEVMAPRPTDVIGDPSCGTAGFLVAALEYLERTHSSPAGTITRDDGSVSYLGDLLEPYRAELVKNLHGFDFDQTMLRIAAMNLILHGIDAPQIHHDDTLSNGFAESDLASGAFDLILANPPFKGSLDESDVHGSLLRTVKTKKTELLFLALILRMLKKGGRCAVIVPDGVLFGSSKAHVGIRTNLVESHGLEAVFSLPAGVFKPYAGVSTAILVFTKAGQTGEVFFYDLEADGFSLDDKRQPVKENDLPTALAAWQARETSGLTDRSAKAFEVPKADIVAKGYDLSINRYRETKHETVAHEHPREILAKLRALEAEIAKDLAALEGMVG